MASEITELLITKLEQLPCKEINCLCWGAQVPVLIEELKEFQELVLNGGAEEEEEEEDEYSHPNPNPMAMDPKDWKNLVEYIYSLEDIIEPLIWKTQDKVLVIRNNRSLYQVIDKLCSQLKKRPHHTHTHTHTVKVSKSKSKDVQLQLQQAPTSSELAKTEPEEEHSELGAGKVPISEDNLAEPQGQGSNKTTSFPAAAAAAEDIHHIQPAYSGDAQQAPAPAPAPTSSNSELVAPIPEDCRVSSSYGGTHN